MDANQTTQSPMAKTGMLIRKPVGQVFDAFVDPLVTTRFWFTKSSGRLEAGFEGKGDEIVKKVADSTQGFTLVLAGLKALLEHGVELNLVRDRYPKGVDSH